MGYIWVAELIFSSILLSDAFELFPTDCESLLKLGKCKKVTLENNGTENCCIKFSASGEETENDYE